ncbi:uncharacterized protein [Montipora capricornis]|uniref:uncharacterized protein n=1 Tax=Montipora capricornis TaxID=246305 RepID=UPI0035F18B59
MTLTFRHHLRYRPHDHQLRMPQLQQIRKQGMKQILKAKWLLKEFSDEGFYIFHNNRLLNKSVMCGLTTAISISLFVIFVGMAIFIYKPRRKRQVRRHQANDQPVPV